MILRNVCPYVAEASIKRYEDTILGVTDLFDPWIVCPAELLFDDRCRIPASFAEETRELLW